MDNNRFYFWTFIQDSTFNADIVENIENSTVNIDYNYDISAKYETAINDANKLKFYSNNVEMNEVYYIFFTSIESNLIFVYCVFLRILKFQMLILST